MGWIGEAKAHKFIWKAESNGAIGTHVLGNLPANFVMTSCCAVVKTALTGGGTILCGEDGAGDADGYFGDLDAATGAVKGTGALVKDGVGIDELYHIVDAAKDGVAVTIATALYSAGEIHFYFEGFQS